LIRFDDHFPPRSMESRFDGIDRVVDATALAARLEFPVIVKAVWGSGGHQVRLVRDAGGFVASVRQVAGEAQRVLVQECIPGVGFGFTALAERGQVVAAFMHRRLAEHDIALGTRLAHAATGAVSVDEPELRASGTRLLAALGWNGMAMAEFRRSRRDGHFYLIEVNPRFPGSLDLAIAAGVDFPVLYLQRAAGREVSVPDRYTIGLRYRWLLSKGVAAAFEDPLGYLRGVASVVRPDTRCDLSACDPRPHAVQAREAAWWLRHSVDGRATALRHAAAGMRPVLDRGLAWLSRGRSYAPIALSALILVAMRGFTYPHGDHRLDLAWEGVCLLLGVLGLGVRAMTAGFATDAATNPDDTLEATGTYSVMRHPYHLGTLLLWIAVALFPRTWWLPPLAAAAFWLYYERALAAEEQALRRRFGRDYLVWAAVTPRFLPRLSRWKRPRGRFDLGRVLRREPTALFVLVACFTGLEVLGELNIKSHLAIDLEWTGLFASTAIVYATLAVLGQRRTLRSRATDSRAA
jgi:protein-S-isoprenylcysteine O-methyltransferase Ste14